MISRRERVSAEQLDLIMEKGRVFHSPLFIIRALSVQKDTRIAAVAPKKIFKTAVERNALRRKIYAIIRNHTKSFTKNVHLGIFAKQNAAGATAQEIEKDLGELFVKAGILR